MHRLMLSLILTGSCVASTAAAAPNVPAAKDPAGTPATPTEPTAPSLPAATATPTTNSDPVQPAPTVPVTAPAPAPAASGSAVEPSPYGPATSEPSRARSAQAASEKSDRPPTLLEPGVDYAFGGMGGIGVMYTRIGGKNSALVCGEGAFIIDHALTLGGGGCGVTRLLRAQEYSSKDYDDNDRLTFGYGGAIIRYHFRTRKMVNVSVGALVGAGGVNTGSYTPKSNNDFDNNFKSERHDAVFVVEPQVGAHVNITRWLRVGAVAGYRVVSGVDTKGLTESDVAGPTLGGQIQAGWF